jgi:hypothetical protein
VLDGFRPSRVGIDFIAALASEAPFLIISALYGWFVYFNQKAKASRLNLPSCFHIFTKLWWQGKKK